MVARLFSLLALVLLWLPPANANDTSEGLYLESSVVPAAPYVQQELRYTLRLYRRSSLQTGNFVPPEIPHMVTEEVGEDVAVPVTREGKPWQMIEKRYRLFPQRSGRIEIPAPVFSGRSAFVAGDPTAVEVRPRPKTASAGWWLPAKDLTITEEWLLPDPPVRVGDTIERILTVTVEGLTGAQLPPLPLPEGGTFESQRARSESTHTFDANQTLGKRVEHHLLVPLKDGNLEVPPVTLTWWDVDENSARETILPGRRLGVAPLLKTVSSIADSPPTETAPKSAEPDDRRFLSVTLAALALAAIGGLLWLTGHTLSSPAIQRRRARAGAMGRLRAACRKNDARAARAALIGWGRARWTDPPLGLGAMAGRLGNPEVGQAFHDLDTALYGRNAGGQASWEGARFFARIRPALDMAEHALEPEKTSPRLALPPLNPGA